MKTISALISLALAGAAVAQFQGLPTCAQGCAGQYLAGGIGNCGTNAACICASSDFISGIACCLAGACSPSDQSSAVTFAQQICTANGVSVPSAVSCTSTLTSSATTSGSTGGVTAAGNGTISSATLPATVSSSKNHVPKQTAAPGVAVLGGLAAVAAALL